MSKKTAGRKSVPDRALVACLEALAAWEDGAALGQILPRDPVVRCIVQNTLLTLFRHRAVLDWLIDRCADGKVRPRIRRVLRWGVCQVVYLDGLSAAAATD